MKKTTAALGIAMVLAGCGGGDSGGGGAAEQQTTAHKAPPELVGTYKRKVTRADIVAAHASLAGPPVGLPVGGAVMRLLADGEIGLLLSDQGAEPGMFTVDGSKLTVKIPGFCLPVSHPSQATGTYTAVRSGGVLTISAPQDVSQCRDRVAALVGRWHTAPPDAQP